MARANTPTSVKRISSPIAARPNTAEGHSAAARDHARLAAHHASRAEALSRDKAPQDAALTGRTLDIY
jgi:hypothetical protein